MQEDISSNPNSPALTYNFPDINSTNNSENRVPGVDVRRSLSDQMRSVDGRNYESTSCDNFDLDSLYSEAKTSSVNATPSRGRLWCMRREACIGGSPVKSP